MDCLVSVCVSRQRRDLVGGDLAPSAVQLPTYTRSRPSSLVYSRSSSYSSSVLCIKSG